MMMQKVMEKRRSVREYKHKVLEVDHFDRLMDLIDHVPQIAHGVQVRFHIVRDGDAAYRKLSGIAGYNGVMIEAPHYLVILANKHESQYKVAGYSAEWLVLNLTKDEIGTCWIDTNNQADRIKAVLELETTDDVVGLLAIGYAAMDVRLSNIYDTMRTGAVSSLSALGYPHVDIGYAAEPISGRVSIVDLVFLKHWNQTMTLEEIEQRGLAEVFFYMRLAPSWGNQQPWRFVLLKEGIALVVLKEYGANDIRTTEIDAGIAMLYFETAMHSEGLPGSWELSAANSSLEVPDSYHIVGLYTY